MNYIQQIELEFCTVSLREDGIIENRFLVDTPYEIEARNLKEIAHSMINLSGAQPKPILNIAGLNGSISPEARKLNFNEDKIYTLALALVIQELAQRILANFYFKIKKVDYPVKIFKTEAEATEWLQQQVRLNQKAG